MKLESRTLLLLASRYELLFPRLLDFFCRSNFLLMGACEPLLVERVSTPPPPRIELFFEGFFVYGVTFFTPPNDSLERFATMA